MPSKFAAAAKLCVAAGFHGVQASGRVSGYGRIALCSDFALEENGPFNDRLHNNLKQKRKQSTCARFCWVRHVSGKPAGTT